MSPPQQMRANCQLFPGKWTGRIYRLIWALTAPHNFRMPSHIASWPEEEIIMWPICKRRIDVLIRIHHILNSKSSTPNQISMVFLYYILFLDSFEDQLCLFCPLGYDCFQVLTFGFQDLSKINDNGILGSLGGGPWDWKWGKYSKHIAFNGPKNHRRNLQLQFMREKISIKKLFAIHLTLTYGNCHSESCWPNGGDALSKWITDK